MFRKILNGEIKPYKLVRFSPDELASKDLAEWKDKDTKHVSDAVSLSPPTFRKNGEGHVLTCICLCVCSKWGYLDIGVPTIGWRYLPWLGGGGVPTLGIPTLGGGGYLDHGVPTLAWGIPTLIGDNYLCQGGVPPLAGREVPTLTRRGTYPGPSPLPTHPTPAKVGTPPPSPAKVGIPPSKVSTIPSWKTDQHSEYLLLGGRYASYVHAGGLSCSKIILLCLVSLCAINCGCKIV